MEEKGPKVTEPKATRSGRSRPVEAGSPDGKDDAEVRELGPEEIARQLFASYLEPATEESPGTQEERKAAQLELAPAPEGEAQDRSQPEPIEPAETTAGELAAVESPVDLAPEDQEDQEPQVEGEAEEAAEGEEAEEAGRHWYVIHSYSGYESKVKKNLEHRIESLGMHDRIFQVVVPTEDEIELKDGQRRTIERRIFPGYILVEMLMDQDSWGVVRNTPGVTGFVGTRNEPTPLRRHDVDRVLKRMRAETPKVKVTFRPGQKVRIADGPFEDFVGTVDGIYPDKGKVRILVSFFGRETPVELDFLQVEKI